jgi:hypothetical protein
MINKKVLIISLALTLLTGIVATFYACKDDDKKSDPAGDGKKAAQEVCSCFGSSQSDSARTACYSKYESRKAKYKDAKDIQEFDDAFQHEIGTCSIDPVGDGKKAAQELCACLDNANPKTVNDACYATYESKRAKYEKDAKDRQAFDNAFYGEIKTCSSFLTYFGMRAAHDLAACFATATDDNGKHACMMGLSLVYGNYQDEDDFAYAFTMELYENYLDVLEFLCANYGGCEELGM